MIVRDSQRLLVMIGKNSGFNETIRYFFNFLKIQLFLKYFVLKIIINGRASKGINTVNSLRYLLQQNTKEIRLC